MILSGPVLSSAYNAWQQAGAQAPLLLVKQAGDDAEHTLLISSPRAGAAWLLKEPLRR